MQRTISSELASNTFSSLSRAWSSGSGSSALVKFEEVLAGGLQHVFGVRSQHAGAAESLDVNTVVNRAQPAQSDLSRKQGSTAPTSGVRAIHSSTSQPDKDTPAPVIGTRDTCYAVAPACIDITAERRAAAEAHMTWEAYVKLHKDNSC